jgi:polyhydroxyalkanoate synthesis regulator phasin
VKYRVPIRRIGYRHTEVEFEADTPEEAVAKAEDLADDLEFPPEYSYDYQVRPAKEIPDRTAITDAAELERLVRLANELSLPDEALDDAVHDCAQDETLGELNGTDAKDVQEDLIGSSEERASKINNGGIKSQIEYLLQHNDAATVEQLIREKAE